MNEGSDVDGSGLDAAGTAAHAAAPVSRRTSFALAALVALDGALGLAALATVGFGRATSFLPRPGRSVYLAHSLLGVALGVGALARWSSARAAGRVQRACAAAGLVGVALGACGGALADVRAARLGGAALMFLGVAVAFLAYLTAGLATDPADGRGGEVEAVGAP